MTEHTPGPWMYQRGDIGDLGNEEGFTVILSDLSGGSYPVHHVIRYAECVYPEDGEQHAEAEANARLIAAAPELYEALEEAIEAIEKSAVRTDYTREALTKARAALAAAAGEERSA